MSFSATKLTSSVDRARVHCDFRQNVFTTISEFVHFFFMCVALFSTHVEPLRAVIMIECIVSDKRMGGKSVRNDIYVAQIVCFFQITASLFTETKPENLIIRHFQKTKENMASVPEILSNA